MCKVDGSRANQHFEKLPNVDRSNKDVPIAPAEIDDNNTGSAFGPDDKNEIKHYNDKDDKVIKNLNLCSTENEEPGVYMCTAKTGPDDKEDPKYFNCTAKIDPDDKDEPKIFECTAKIGPEPKEHSPGIYQCITKVKHVNFDEIRQKPTEVKDLFKSKDRKFEVHDGREKDKPKIKNDNPGFYNCTYKFDPDKKDDKPEFFNCANKIDPNKKDDKSGFYNCSYKLDIDKDL